MILIKNDKIVLATNTDIEIYALVALNNANSIETFTNLEDMSVSEAPINIKIKELKKYSSAHKDSILCLENISDILFASGSSDGNLIVWHSETLMRTMSLKPFEELNLNENLLRLSLNSIITFKCLLEVCGYMSFLIQALFLFH